MIHNLVLGTVMITLTILVHTFGLMAVTRTMAPPLEVVAATASGRLSIAINSRAARTSLGPVFPCLQAWTSRLRR